MKISEMTPEIKQKLNLLADMMLMVDGYKSCLHSESEGGLYDCSTSYLPRCQKAWNKAVTAYSFLNNNPEMLRFQVKFSGKKIFEVGQDCEEY
jgi:hypothetical protein